MSITVNSRVDMLLDAIHENSKRGTRDAKAKAAAAQERIEPLVAVPFEATTEQAINVLNHELRFHVTGKKYARDEIRQMLSILKTKLNTEKEKAWKEGSRKARAELDAIGEKALNAKITREQIAEYQKSYEWTHTPAEAVGYQRRTRPIAGGREFWKQFTPEQVKEIKQKIFDVHIQALNNRTQIPRHVWEMSNTAMIEQLRRGRDLVASGQL